MVKRIIVGARGRGIRCIFLLIFKKYQLKNWPLLPISPHFNCVSCTMIDNKDDKFKSNTVNVITDRYSVCFIVWYNRFCGGKYGYSKLNCRKFNRVKYVNKIHIVIILIDCTHIQSIFKWLLECVYLVTDILWCDCKNLVYIYIAVYIHHHTSDRDIFDKHDQYTCFLSNISLRIDLKNGWNEFITRLLVKRKPTKSMHCESRYSLWIIDFY